MSFIVPQNRLNVLGLLLLSMSLTWGSQCWAGEGGASDGGGGDPCEERIQEVRYDIAGWIRKGGFLSLKLPRTVSPAAYRSEMTSAIGLAKIRCVSEGDEGFPVEINRTPKVCRFDFAPHRIKCDARKFAALNESEQYRLIHHEYAGLSHVEIPNGDDSNYQVSNQITSFLEDALVKKLAVKVTQVSDSWRTVTDERHAEVAQSLGDLLANSKFADCDLFFDQMGDFTKIHSCGNSTYREAMYSLTPTKQVSGRGVTALYTSTSCGEPNAGNKLMVSADANQQVIRYLSARDLRGSYFSSGPVDLDIRFYINGSINQIDRVQVSFQKEVRKNVGTAVLPVFRNVVESVYSFSCHSQHYSDFSGFSKDILPREVSHAP